MWKLYLFLTLEGVDIDVFLLWQNFHINSYQSSIKVTPFEPLNIDDVFLWYDGLKLESL